MSTVHIYTEHIATIDTHILHIWTVKFSMIYVNDHCHVLKVLQYLFHDKPNNPINQKIARKKILRQSQ